MLYFNTVFGKGILIQTVTPIGKMMQKVVHQFYSSNTFIHPLGTLILSGEAAQVNSIYQFFVQLLPKRVMHESLELIHLN